MRCSRFLSSLRRSILAWFCPSMRLLLACVAKPQPTRRLSDARSALVRFQFRRGAAHFAPPLCKVEAVKLIGTMGNGAFILSKLNSERFITVSCPFEPSYLARQSGAEFDSVLRSRSQIGQRLSTSLQLDLLPLAAIFSSCLDLMHSSASSVCFTRYLLGLMSHA